MSRKCKPFCWTGHNLTGPKKVDIPARNCYASFEAFRALLCPRTGLSPPD
jgi:hypothetical protein